MPNPTITIRMHEALCAVGEYMGWTVSDIGRMAFTDYLAEGGGAGRAVEKARSDIEEQYAECVERHYEMQGLLDSARSS